MQSSATIEKIRQAGRVPVQVPLLFLMLAGLMISALFYVGAYMGEWVISIGSLALVPVIVLFIKYPRIWLYAVSAFLIVFMRSMGQGLSVADIITGLLLLGGLFFWFMWNLMVTKAKLVRNKGDWFFLFFYLMLVFNSVIAILNYVPLLHWIREVSIFSLTLYYFPIRMYFNDKKHLMRLLMLLGAVVSVVGILHYYTYYQMIQDIVYAYQLGFTSRVNQSLYSMGAVFGIIFVLYNRSKFKQMIMLGYTVLTVGALIITYSRTFWILLLINVIIMFLFLSRRHKIKLMQYAVIISIFVGGIVMAAFRDNAEIMYNMLVKRFTSSTQGLKDISLIARLHEYSKAFEQVKSYPLGGNGFAKQFTFHDPIFSQAKHTSNIHNGYLYLLYRVGLPLTMCYFFPLLFYLFRAGMRLINSPPGFWKFILLGGFLGLLVIMIANFTSAQNSTRDGVFVIAFSIAFISIAEQKIANIKAEKSCR